MNYKPLGTRVIIIPQAAAQTTESGIIIPDSVKQKRNVGDVAATGEQCIAVKVGDKVMFPADSGTEIEINKEKLLLMFEETIDLIL